MVGQGRVEAEKVPKQRVTRRGKEKGEGKEGKEGKEWEVKVSRRERRIGMGKGEGTKGESWNSKGRKVKVLERKGIGNAKGTNVGESGKIGMEWEGKRRGKRTCTMVEAQGSQNPERWILESRVGKKGRKGAGGEVGNRALGKRDKRERRERKLEFTWNGKGSYVWKGRRREGVKEEKEGSEWGREKERSGRREKGRKERMLEGKWELGTRRE
jgi:hypothetical protein